MALTRKNQVGTILEHAGPNAQPGTLFCYGQAVSRTQYPALFATIGVSYGSGDGSTTFNVPDRRYNFGRGAGNVSNVTGTGTAASNNATFTNHNLNRTGFRVRVASGTLSGLTTATDYYAIVVDANTLAFATTYANAIAGTKIAITGANSAVITQWEDPDAATRVASAVGGNSGASVGSRQADDLKSHTHVINCVNVGNGYAGGGNLVLNRSDGAVSGATGGGNDTRPNNIAVNYVIVY